MAEINHPYYEDKENRFFKRAGQHPIKRPTCLSFRMSVSDFRQNFEVMEVCHLTEAFQGSSKQPWSCSMHHGNWVPSITAGGPPIGSKRRKPLCTSSMYPAPLGILRRTDRH